MKRKPKPDSIDNENPEWTEEDFDSAKPAAELLPEIFGQETARQMLKPRGRPKAGVTKEHVNIRLDADVVQAFKSTGRGWQTRLNRALREWLKENKPEKTQQASYPGDSRHSGSMMLHMFTVFSVLQFFELRLA
jgi:uncharacterized protein (DUF4415 family)